MDAFELLKGWPGWANANAEKVLMSPAWRLPIEYGGGDAVLRRMESDDSDLLWLDMALDDEPHRLGLADSPEFPDLHALWAVRKGLPREVVLALVEKECGELLQALENSLRMGLSLKGLAEGPGDGRVCGFGAFGPDADEPSVRFAIDLSPKVMLAYGQLANLDTDHPSIRSLEIETEAEYAAMELGEDELSRLAVGDRLLVPEDAEARWRIGADRPAGLRLVNPGKGSVTFGELADGELPPVPEPDEVCLVRGGRTFARGAFGDLLGTRVVIVRETSETSSER